MDSKDNKKSWFEITNKADNTAEIDINDEIGFFGVTAKDFVTALRSLPKNIDSVTLNINCPGGDCNDGFTIYDAIKALKVPVTANIVGLAASMASVIMLAAKTINIAENGRVMIHRVGGGARGNADDVEAAAKIMRQFENRIVSLYVDRTGRDEAEIRDLMKAEMGTWFFGQEAVDAGFADSVTKGVKAKAFKNQWAQLFTHLPSALFDMQEPERSNSPSNTHPMTDQQKTRFRALLAQDKRSKEEEAEFVALKADADKAKYDPTVDILQDKVNALEAEKTARANAELEAKAKADADAKAKADADKFSALVERIERAEKLIASGVLASAGGTDPAKLKQGEQGEKTMKLENFNKLDAAAKAKFIREGGKLAD